MAYNLTDKQMQLVRDLVRLCETSQHKSFSYTPTFNSRDTIEAHGTNLKAAGTERDLRTLEAEGIITLRWVRHGAANGTVLPRAIEAVRDNFGLPREAPTAAVPPAVAVAPAAANAVMDRAAPARPAPVAGGGGGAAGPQPVGVNPPATVASAASGGEVLYQLTRAIADLSATFREAVPVDEAESAEADAAAINRQLHARQSDPEVVARRTRSIVARVSLAMNGAADLAGKGERYADALRKLAAFVALVGQWIVTQRRGA